MWRDDWMDFCLRWFVEDTVWYVIPCRYMMVYTSEMIYMNDTLLNAFVRS
jgi:hypothetical protein